MYNTEITSGDTMLNSTNINLAGFGLNILIIYLILYTINKLTSKNPKKENTD